MSLLVDLKPCHICESSADLSISTSSREISATIKCSKGDCDSDQICITAKSKHSEVTSERIKNVVEKIKNKWNSWSLSEEIERKTVDMTFIALSLDLDLREFDQ